MPIRPEYRFLYPIDWLQLSATIRFGRAGGRCEHCGRPHGEIVLHLGDGRWWDAKRGERDLIRERTRAGLDAARARCQCGRGSLLLGWPQCLTICAR